MNTTHKGIVIGTTAAIAAAGVMAIGASQQGAQPGRTAQPGEMRMQQGRNATDPAFERLIAQWPDISQKAARDMYGKYGPPQEATSSRVIWHDNGPWKRTTVHRETIEHHFPMPHEDLLEQVVHYNVPPDKFSDLALYDGSVIVFRTGGELRAMCDDEAMNFLAINLAHEIVEGKRSVGEARQFYAETAMAFKQGRESSHTQGLLFEPPDQGGDPDTAVIEDGKIVEEKLEPHKGDQNKGHRRRDGR